MPTLDGYGFHVLDENRAPQVTFEYDDQQVAMNMRRLVKEALASGARTTVHRSVA
jgi:hypothetical protein